MWTRSGACPFRNEKYQCDSAAGCHIPDQAARFAQPEPSYCVQSNPPTYRSMIASRRLIVAPRGSGQRNGSNLACTQKRIIRTSVSLAAQYSVFGSPTLLLMSADKSSDTPAGDGGFQGAVACLNATSRTVTVWGCAGGRCGILIEVSVGETQMIDWGLDTISREIGWLLVVVGVIVVIAVASLFKK
jgi:hypothetical protein